MSPAPPLSTAGHLRAVLTLGLPLVGGHLAQFSIGMTDTIMMGWYSVEGLAAVTLAGTVFFVLFIAGSGFAHAVMPMVANHFAKSEEAEIRRVARMGLWLSALYGAVTLPLFWWSGPIMQALGQEDALAADVQSYLRIAGWGLLPALGVMVLKSYLAALERTQIVLWVTLAATVLNALLNYALIFGNFGAPELGLRGSAIASVIVQIASLALIVLYAARIMPQHTLFQRLWRPDWEVFFRVARLGLPIGLTLLAEVGFFAAATVMMGWLGTVTLAAHGVVLNLASATFMIHLGLANVATIRAGGALGRGDRVHLVHGAWVVLGVSGGFALMTIAAFLLIPGPLVSLFVSPDEPSLPDILRTGALLLGVAGLFQLVDAIQVIALGLLRGLQDTKLPMLYAAFSYWVIGVPASYLLGIVLGFGGVGIWAGLAVGLTFAAIFMLRRFWRLSRRTSDAGLAPSA